MADSDCLGVESKPPFLTSGNLLAIPPTTTTRTATPPVPPVPPVTPPFDTKPPFLTPGATIAEQPNPFVTSDCNPGGPISEYNRITGEVTEIPGCDEVPSSTPSFQSIDICDNGKDDDGAVDEKGCTPLPPEELPTATPPDTSAIPSPPTDLLPTAVTQLPCPPFREVLKF